MRHPIEPRWWMPVVSVVAVVLAACSSTPGADVDEVDPAPSSTAGPAAPTSPTALTSVADLDPAWAQVLTGPTAEDEIDGVAAGSGGSVFVTGKFEQQADIGGVRLESAGRADIPLARFDVDGEPMWVRRFGGPGEDNIFDIDANDDGAVATGIFEGTVDLGAVTLTSAGGIDCLVASVANDGEVRWAVSFGGPGADGCNEVAVDDDGTVVTSLDTEGGWDSPAGPIEQGQADTVLLRLQAGGEVDWARRVGGPGRQRNKALGVAADGTVAFGGDSRGPLDLDGTVLEVPGGGWDAWLSVWTPSGELEWSRSWGGPGADIVKGLAFDGDALYAAGSFADEVDIAGTELVAGRADALAVARFSRSGRLEWATSVRADEPVLGAEVVTTDDGGILFGVVAAGLEVVSASGEVTTLDESADRSVVLVQLRPDGSVALVAPVAGTSGGRPGELDRVGRRLYLDVAVRGGAMVVGGDTIQADRKDAGLWAVDFPVGSATDD